MMTIKTVDSRIVVKSESHWDGNPDGTVGDWAAYYGPVAWGEDEVRTHGDKLLESVARGIFLGVSLPYRP